MSSSDREEEELHKESYERNWPQETFAASQTETACACCWLAGRPAGPHHMFTSGNCTFVDTTTS